MNTTAQKITFSVLIASIGFIAIPQIFGGPYVDRGIVDLGFAATVGGLCFAGLALKNRS